MAEGKTNMFGKAYNTIGSTDSNFIIKTKGDLKIQWGNKYIDLIKNGKVASQYESIFKIVDTEADIKGNGIYLVSEEQLWISINDKNFNISQESDNGTTYVSFLTEQETTGEQKHRALTNIGFYYENIEDVKGISSGIVYVEADQKLYIIKNGTLFPYEVKTQQVTEGTEISKDLAELRIGPFHLYEAEGYAIIDSTANMLLSVQNVPYLVLEDEAIRVKQSLQVPVDKRISSEGSNENYGYQLYIHNGLSTLEIDNIVWRKHPTLITYAELIKKIENKQLAPKLYYQITDFQNPWEVTWESEPVYYEDEYQEINSVKHLKGVRNAMKLIVRAANEESLEKEAWSPLHPEWIIHYDPLYRGPEHKISEENIQYGFRSTNEAGVINYLSCKGQITYLKDELGNEGNFNFRQFMFKQGTNWRYVMDSETKEVLGKFFEGTNNKFFIDSLESFVQVFTFEEIKNTSGAVTGYNMVVKDSNVQISKGHSLFVQATIIEGNTFQLSKTEETVNHVIQKNIKNNNFINQIKLIKINIDCEGNTFENFTNPINISGKEFNNNYLTNFTGNISNSEYFNDNIINKCDGLITNNNNFIKNTINEIKSDVTNNYIFSENIINSISNLTINGQISNNYLEDIEECTLKSFIGNSAYKRLYRLVVQTSMTNCVFREDISSLTVTNVFDSQFDFIDSLTLDDDVYFTTFHGRIGNITKQLTEFEKEWLKDASKKTDAYPNIRVVCIPEIIIKGMIIMWYGQEPIPKGWALCDGNNGTPNLINKFIKSSDGFIVGGTSIGDNSDTIEPSLTEDNKLKLTVEHLPTHRHPHLPHSHEAGSATSNYVESYSYSYTDSTGEDTETKYDTSYYNTDIDHTHTIYEETSKEDESITFDNKLFSIEPRAYKLIFIMKIDEDTISQS